MKLAIIGATGLVGKTLLTVIQERNFAYKELFLVASEGAAGEYLLYNEVRYELITLKQALAAEPTVAILSAGSELSLNWAPKFTALGTKVIDNSEAWRLDPGCKLIVPEINAHLLTAQDCLIANPNCSTIQLVMVLAPLHQLYKVKRLVLSTYQGVTGSGKLAVEQLLGERQQLAHIPQAYEYSIDLNLIPYIGQFGENGYTTEEGKLVNETRKILGDLAIQVTATAVRVPVLGGHAMAVNVEFAKEYVLEEVVRSLKEMPGVVVQDWKENQYPMPLLAQNQDAVFVGRIRRDDSQPHSLNLWIVADNLRKGAATNAIQIVEYLQTQQLL